MCRSRLSKARRKSPGFSTRRSRWRLVAACALSAFAGSVSAPLIALGLHQRLGSEQPKLTKCRWNGYPLGGRAARGRSRLRFARPTRAGLRFRPARGVVTSFSVAGFHGRRGRPLRVTLLRDPKTPSTKRVSLATAAVLVPSSLSVRLLACLFRCYRRGHSRCDAVGSPILSGTTLSLRHVSRVGSQRHPSLLFLSMYLESRLRFPR